MPPPEETSQPIDEARAVAAAVAVGRALGLRVEEPVVLARFYAVRVHLAPSPVVARVPTWTAIMRSPIRPWLEREIQVVRFLEAEAMPVVPTAKVVDAGPHERDGVTLSFWHRVETSAEPRPTDEEFARMLLKLHACLRRYPGELPVLAPPRLDIELALDRLRASGSHLDELAILERAYARVGSALRAPAGPIQALHGDAHAANVLSTPSGYLWNDFEDVCAGPIAWDLAALSLRSDVVAHYPDPPAREEIARYQEIRRMHVAVWLLLCPVPFEGRDAALASMLSSLG